MSAFKDSGHHWWRRCDGCGMAIFVGNKPADPDGDWTCDTCRGDGPAIVAAEARGFARARAKAADVMEDMAAGFYEGSRSRAVSEDGAARIRAMQDEGTP